MDIVSYQVEDDVELCAFLVKSTNLVGFGAAEGELESLERLRFARVADTLWVVAIGAFSSVFEVIVETWGRKLTTTYCSVCFG